MGCDIKPPPRASRPAHFNPRTHMGCDPKRGLPPQRYTAHFNPRTHMGCDLGLLQGSAEIFKISIHAPTWGATTPSATMPDEVKYFNPRTHMGCDCGSLSSIMHILSFQSTHPHGVRLQKQCNIINCKANMSIIIPHPRIYYIFQAGKPPFNHHISQPLVRIPFAENVSLGFAS